MDFKRATDQNIKYILGSLLYKAGCGQACIRAAYEEYLDKGTINYSREIVQSFAAELKANGIEIVKEDEELYPNSLTALPDRPIVIFAKGDTALLNKHCIGIVGSRKCTLYGTKAVHWLLTALKSFGREFVCISGLAYGIDGAAHRNSLLNDIPTIAVVAGGIDNGYPRSHRSLYQDISMRGLILSEFPPGIAVIKGMFPMRNRILAALCSSLVVIEAGYESGALITANFANELGREVFALPGSIFQPYSVGSHMLIQSGANLLTDNTLSLLLEPYSG